MTKLKERLHQLVDGLPRSELTAAERYLRFLRTVGSDPLLRSLAAAPYDDEPFTKDDEAAVREADAETARGEFVADEKVSRRRKR